MKLLHEVGKFIELGTAGAQPLWRYVYAGSVKPFFHPLATPAGHVLSIFEPHDHIWQRGLWFAIKYINGENFWEEKPAIPWGTQITQDYPNALLKADGAIEVSSRLTWLRPNEQGAVIDEHRRFIYRPIDLKSYAIDFCFELTALAELTLDRTVFTTWGGYGGLAFRGNRNWQQTKLMLADGSLTDRPVGVPGDWCDLTGKLDGGSNLFGGIAMFDHPQNPRSPSPWYGSTGANHFFNAAFLFHEPMILPAGNVLKLQYRVLVHDGARTREELQAASEAYRAP